MAKLSWLPVDVVPRSTKHKAGSMSHAARTATQHALPRCNTKHEAKSYTPTQRDSAPTGEPSRVPHPSESPLGSHHIPCGTLYLSLMISVAVSEWLRRWP